MIAHRLSTCRNADKIVVMGNGRKIEEGNHDSLMAMGDSGAYYAMIQRHHGLVPGDDTGIQFPEGSTVYEPSPADLHAAVTTLSNEMVAPTSLHPVGVPAGADQDKLTGCRSRPSAGLHGYSTTVANMEEANASVEAAEKAFQDVSRKARMKRFFGYTLKQRWWIIPGGLASILMYVFCENHSSSKTIITMTCG